MLPESADAARALAELRQRFTITRGPGLGYAQLTSGKIRPRVYRVAGPRWRWGEVELPSTASDAFELRELGTKFGVTVRLAGANPSQAQSADGLLVFANAFQAGTVVHRATDDGVEDYVELKAPPPQGRVSYELRLSPEIAGLRLVDRNLELLDAKGTPRLRMAAPTLIDATQAELAPDVSITGCAFSADPTAPWGKAVTPPGATTCTVTLSIPAKASFPALLDPSWTSTGSLSVARFNAVAARLLDGRVLIAGGENSAGTPLGTAQIYDETSGTFSVTGSFPGGGGLTRSSAVLLDDGRVLLTGGLNASGLPAANALIWRIDLGGWQGTTAMAVSRVDFQLVKLADGRVAAIGGRSNFALPYVEIFNPTTSSWSNAASMATGRQLHTATLLPNGNVLVVGGRTTSAPSSALASTEIYQTATNTWITGPAISTARAEHTASFTLGKVVITAGVGTNGGVLRSTQVYDPSSNAWSGANPLITARTGHRATVVASGRVLVSGGYDGVNDLGDAELFDLTTGSWVSGGVMSSPRAYHLAAPLPSGKVLVAGGMVEPVTRACTGAAEVYAESVPGGGQNGGQTALDLNIESSSYTGVKPMSGSIQVNVTNTRSDVTLSYRLWLKSAGTGHLEYMQNVGDFVIAPSQTLSHTFPIAQLTVQPSVPAGAQSGNEAIYQWFAMPLSASCTGCETLYTMIPSAPVSYAVDPSYTQATFWGVPGTTAGASSSPPYPVPKTFAQEWANLTPVRDVALSLTGRYYDPNLGYSELPSLPPYTQDGIVFKNAVRVNAVETSRLNSMLRPYGGACSGCSSGFQFCAKWYAPYLDDNVGEANAAHGEITASYATGAVIDADTNNPDCGTSSCWRGTLDALGCTPTLSLTTGKSYMFWYNAIIDNGSSRVVVTEAPSAASPSFATGFSVLSQPSGISQVVVRAYNGKYVSAAAGAVTQALTRLDNGVKPGVQFRVAADRPCPSGGTACNDNSVTYLGRYNPGTNGEHNALWKSVVNHEFGHGLQFVAMGWPKRRDYTGDATQPSVCRCDHVSDPTDRSHCMQSAEYSEDAQAEAFAHFLSSKAWSGDSPFACNYPYYKEFFYPIYFAPDNLRRPPYSISCTATVRRLENNCTQIADHGVEWDWLNFFRANHVASNPGNWTMQNYYDAYLNACNGQPCGASSVSYLQLQVAANNLYSASQIEKVTTFTTNASAFGVAH